jgi:peptidoglycan-associated lipoprotein
VNPPKKTKMQLMRFTNLMVMGLVLSFIAVGCKTKKSGATPLPGAGLSGSGGLGEGGKLGTGDTGSTVDSSKFPGGGEAATFDPDQMNQDRAALAAQTVYFAYDSSTISPSEHSKLEAVASALNSDMSAKLLVEGNCDERGTEEYNRSLGERRALSAREALAGLGVDPSRVATRSYGEDRPAEAGQDEAAYSRNRRDDFVLLHPK